MTSNPTAGEDGHHSDHLSRALDAFDAAAAQLREALKAAGREPSRGPERFRPPKQVALPDPHYAVEPAFFWWDDEEEFKAARWAPRPGCVRVKAEVGSGGGALPGLAPYSSRARVSLKVVTCPMEGGCSGSKRCGVNQGS